MADFTQSLLGTRKLLVVTGKGGVGKTTIAAAIGLAAASSGLRTIVVEVGEESRLPTLFKTTAPEPGAELALQEGLSAVSIDPDRAILEWLQALGGRISGRVLASSGTFQYFAAAAPGATELVSMVKIWQLTRERTRRGREGYDLVVLDAPATGHALGLLGSPKTFGAIARVGPIAGQAEQVGALLEDPARSAYLAVALASEMAVTEALELQEGLRKALGRGLSAVIVNGLLPKRFTPAEIAKIAATGDSASRLPTLTRAAAHAARSIHERARFQQNQLARLRRRDFQVVGVPFAWSTELDLPAVREIAALLARKL